MASERATNGLKPIANLGWTAGLRNMLRKENGKWWGWKSLAVQLVIWTLIINSMVALAVFVIPQIPVTQDMKDAVNQSGSPEDLAMLDYTPAAILQLGLQMFFQIAGFALLVGGVIIAHDAILKERETGTAAWLLSKPISRKAFVLSKLAANIVGLLVVVIAVQAAIAYAQIVIATGMTAPVLPFLGGLGILSLNAVFYLVLALALGAFTLSRGATLGLPIVIGIVGSILLQVVDQLKYVTPWTLGDMALGVAMGASLPDWAIIPIIATIVWILAFAGAAIWRFERLEL